MKNIINIVLCVVLTGQITFAQTSTYSPSGPENNYRTPQNPYYWKNRLPFPGYWQQDVHYKIKANLDEQTWMIDGEEELTYWNNSPDTLTFVYFHLYQNAFQPGSYLDNLQRNNGVKAKYGKYESKHLGTEVDYIRSGGKDLKTDKDNTVMRVYLDKPLLPNTSMTFTVKFATFFDNGSTRRRMKFINSFGTKQFNGTHWYPAICVYDRVKGWDTDQHLNREFYNEFGTWDVALTFAANYIVEATGVLQNEDSVLPKELKEKLDIKNFKGKKWNEKPSIIIPYDANVRKTWKYHAENVHNFAFTASPLFRIGETDWKGIRCIALVQEPHAGQWQQVSDFTAKVIETYSRDFGMYGYPKMVVADAEDGMEYPMLTLCGGSYPTNKYLVAHEVGHNWFYGMIGNNETYQAPLDEGFTQFLTAWSLEAIDGKYNPTPKSKWKYVNHFKDRTEVRNTTLFDSYITDAGGFHDEPLNTHSDMFNGALGQGGGYRNVYFKTATMLYNLQYVLGDTLFQNSMKHYFNQWKFAHPYIADFRRSIMDYTHTDLTWFFDEWFNTTKNIDYKVLCVKKVGKAADGKFIYHVKLLRKGRMQMPIEMAVTTKKDTQNYYIPNTWFRKETKDSTLPEWLGWDKLQPTYTATVTTSAKIKNVIIDTSGRLADINMLNNSKRPPIKVMFDSQVSNRPAWKYYQLYMRPDLWWNAYDGFKLGFHMHGSYMGNRHKFSFTAWWNTNLLTELTPYRVVEVAPRSAVNMINYNLSYETSLNKYIRDSKVFLSAKYLDGLEAYTLGYGQIISPKLSFDIFAKSMGRPRPNDLSYLVGYSPNTIDSSDWVAGKYNFSLNLEFKQKYEYPHGTGSVDYYLRSSFLTTDYSYQYLAITAINHTALWKFDLHTRVFGRFGTGDNVASESALYLAGANPEEMMESPLTRSAGYVPPAWTGYSDDHTNHYQEGGGLNLRGYAGYTVIDEHNGITYHAYKGNSGAAVNAELDFNRLVPVKSQKLKDLFKLNTYLFGDAGFIVYNTDSGGKAMSQPRLDAGVGVAFTIKKWGPFENLKPLTLRFDIPFYISNAPANEPQNVKFRWVVGINRSF